MLWADPCYFVFEHDNISSDHSIFFHVAGLNILVKGHNLYQLIVHVQLCIFCLTFLIVEYELWMPLECLIENNA